jgi:hypothetical protein
MLKGYMSENRRSDFTIYFFFFLSGKGDLVALG